MSPRGTATMLLSPDVERVAVAVIDLVVAGRAQQEAADNPLSAISAMLTWSVDRGTLTANHLRGFKRLYHADRSEIIWLPEHINAFMKVAPIEMRQD
jgi:hypothetical protein